MPAPEKHPDLHGNVPENCRVAVVLVDVLNALRFEGSEGFVPKALAVAERVARLKQRAAAANVPVVYVNDNAGRWQSDVSRVLEDCLKDDAPGREASRLVLPGDRDFFVMKPKHSGFYSTTLDTLLVYLQAKRLVIAGFTVERCVLFTANDAFLRDYELYVPKDCTAAIDDRDSDAALRILERVLRAHTQTSDELDFEQLKA
ncbi:MAG: cysteine hydrolase [Myxococcota bacterium]|nr:cysteine hydrolase [Myxococcota bacterium]